MSASPSSFWRARSGTVAIIVAAFLPLLLLAMLGGTTVMRALSERRALQAVAQTVCNRAVKPQRMQVMNDSDRTAYAIALFNALAADQGFTVTSKSITSNWLESTVSATIEVDAMPGWGLQAAIPVSATEVCRGVPPYPKLGDAILSSNFRTPSGNSIGLTRGTGINRWDMFTPQQVGWDGGTGPGLEIQDWSKGFNLSGPVEYLSAGVTNPYVVELDSDFPANYPASSKIPSTCRAGAFNVNSSMHKAFELHPGTYRFSMRYRARVAQNPNDSNRIAVYLEGTRPVSEKVLRMAISDVNLDWRERSFDIPVTSYGLYRLHVAAEGCGDGRGGLFNDLKLTYVRRPAPEYNDQISAPTDQ